jgi:hypothetical protein
MEGHWKKKKKTLLEFSSAVSAATTLCGSERWTPGKAEERRL